MKTEHQKAVQKVYDIEKNQFKGNITKLIKEKKKQMAEAVKVLDFETAALIRDEIKMLEKEDER